MFFLRYNRDSRIVFKIHELDKKNLQEIASDNGMTLSSFILNAINFYVCNGDLNVRFKKEK